MTEQGPHHHDVREVEDELRHDLAFERASRSIRPTPAISHTHPAPAKKPAASTTAVALTVLAVIELERPEGVIVQFGGQTPLRLAAGLVDHAAHLYADDVAGDEDRLTHRSQLFEQGQFMGPRFGILNVVP